MWQPETVTDPKTKKKIPFQDAPIDVLRKQPSAWVLHPGGYLARLFPVSLTTTACSTPSR